MKIFTVGIIIIGSVICVFGQNAATQTSVCTNETARKVSSRGISIGANLDSVVNLFALTEEEKRQLVNSRLNTDYEHLGYKFFGFSPNQNLQQQNEKFAGISDYIFNFLDNRLTGFSVSYTKPVWRNSEQFTTKLAEILGLPDIKFWNSEEGGSLTLNCGDYRIVTNTSGERSTLGIYDTRVTRILEQRKKQAADKQLEKDLKTFKP